MAIPTSRKEKIELLEYEIWMFREIYKRLNLKPAMGFGNNLLVESLAIHARILVDFFYFPKENENDIIAQDLMPEGKNWAQIRPLLTEVLKDAKKKANKQLAHLSAWRIKLKKEKKKHWYYNRIWRDMEKVIKAFEIATGKKF